MTQKYNYKSTVCINYWTTQLERINKQLHKRDRKILKNAKNEKCDNESLQRIHARALQDNLYIPCLTELNGDCMFESMQHAGLCVDKNYMRKSVGLLFFLFGNCKLISGHDMTLKELFDMTNDIQYVYCHNNDKLYKYTYYTMCSDMFTDGCWSRLPAELVLMMISIFFKVRFHVYHDNGHVAKICDIMLDNQLSETDPGSNIRVGLIGEHHYIPLVERNGNAQELKCPKYDTELRKFHKWAKEIARMIDQYNNRNHSSDLEKPDHDTDPCNTMAGMSGQNRVPSLAFQELPVPSLAFQELLVPSLAFQELKVPSLAFQELKVPSPRNVCNRTGSSWNDRSRTGSSWNDRSRTGSSWNDRWTGSSWNDRDSPINKTTNKELSRDTNMLSSENLVFFN
jgi:hypothetical protein